MIVRWLVILWAAGLSTPAHAQGECNSFGDCYDRAKAAERAGKGDVAITYYALACPMEVKPVYGALKIAACEQIITLSGASDGYTTANAYFSKGCTQGMKEACFFLSRVAEQQQDFRRAIELMQPLCERDFSLPVVAGYGSCDNLERLEAKWEIQNPKPPRSNVVQNTAFFAIFMFSFVAAVLFGLFLYLRDHRLAASALIASILVFLIYGYYESGVPTSANIRIDLLIIMPALLVNFIVVSIVLLRRKKTDRRKH